jgi:phosphomannomutase/phosphoglucomutase
LIEIVAASGRPLSAQLDGLPKMVSTPEIRVDSTDESKFQLVARVAEELKKTHQVIEVDGVRVLFKDGWGLLRASNTQPVLVMRFEASSEEALRSYQQEIEQTLEAAKLALA